MSTKIKMSDRIAAGRLLRRHGEHNYAAKVEAGHADESYEVQALAEHRDDWSEDTVADATLKHIDALLQPWRDDETDGATAVLLEIDEIVKRAVRL